METVWKGKNKMNLKYSIADLKQESSIVIFGAGVVGELLLHFCRREQIAVVAFCDNNSKKSGRKLMDIPIISFKELQMRHPDSAVLIAVIDIGAFESSETTMAVIFKVKENGEWVGVTKIYKKID